MTSPFRSIVVVGAGAVGGYFGAMLALAGRRVRLIARAATVQAIERDGLRLERAGQVESVRVDATADPAAVRGADLLLVCVKSTDTETVARQIAPHIDRDAVVLSLQNGVDNAPMLARMLPGCSVMAAVVYVAAEVPEPGLVRHHGRGDLVIGAPMRSGAPADPALAARLQSLADCFASAAVPVRIADDVLGELWSKLLLNCVFNAVSGLAQASYAQLTAVPAIRALQHAVVDEVVAVAAADGVALSKQASVQAIDKLAAAMPGQRSSTAQDMARGRPSEIDHLNGYVARRGSELGIATPVNQALFALVRLAESTGVAQRAAAA